MESLIAFVLASFAIAAALVFIAAGLFAVASLWWGDLLEPDRDPPTSTPELERAA